VDISSHKWMVILSLRHQCLADADQDALAIAPIKVVTGGDPVPITPTPGGTSFKMQLLINCINW
jgi:hypothetical protein